MSREIQQIRERGQLTFRPVRGNRCVCNQLPHLGTLSKKQRETLSCKIWPRRGTRDEFPAQEPGRNKRQNYYSKIRQLLAGIAPEPGLNSCFRCGSLLDVQPYQSPRSY